MGFSIDVIGSHVEKHCCRNPRHLASKPFLPNAIRHSRCDGVEGVPALTGEAITKQLQTGWVL
jgi:hypothetical protein